MVCRKNDLSDQGYVECCGKMQLCFNELHVHIQFLSSLLTGLGWKCREGTEGSEVTEGEWGGGNTFSHRPPLLFLSAFSSPHPQND